MFPISNKDICLSPPSFTAPEELPVLVGHRQTADMPIKMGLREPIMAADIEKAHQGKRGLGQEGRKRGEGRMNAERESPNTPAESISTCSLF